MTDGGRQVVEIVVDTAGDRQRIDAVLARLLPDISRARVQALIDGGNVRMGGRTIGERKHRVKPGDVIEVNVPPPMDPEPKGEHIELNVVFEDADLIVIDKPAGVVVHPAAGHESGTLVNALIAHCGDSLSGIGGVRRPGIVHRLDKDTSGLLVVAKADAAHRALADQFAAHGRDGRLIRSYRAVCWRVPDRMHGTIDAPLGRSSQNRTRISVRRASEGSGARAAITHYDVLEVFGGDPLASDRLGIGRAKRNAGPSPALALHGSQHAIAALLRLDLETGRTHQIRVHLAHIGHPILGDAVYGSGFRASARLLNPQQSDALKALGRQALHAAELGFVHPKTGEQMVFESPLPADLLRLIEALRCHHQPDD